MRYPKRQGLCDESDMVVHGRVARVRPGVRVRVRGYLSDGVRHGYTGRGPVVLGVAVLTKVAHGAFDQVLVATREYGRRWFSFDKSAAFVVVEEVD